MIHRVVVALLVCASALITSPRNLGAEMQCNPGIVVRTSDGYNFCMIDPQGGCEYCQVSADSCTCNCADQQQTP